MKLFLNDEEINITKSELNERYINEGSEGVIYQIGKEAVKIYDNDFYGKRLNEEEARKLSKINTKRILLPRRLVYNENREFMGYTSPFIIEYYKDFLGRLTMEKFIDEMNLIRNDLKVLSKNGVSIEDIHQDNFIMSDGLYLCDSGMYRFNDEEPEKIYRKNIAEINDLFTLSILRLYLGLTKKQGAALEQYFEPSFKLFTDKLMEEQDINPKQKVSPYFKKLTNKIK